MAFTPEDGTGVVGANSFVDVPYADEYFLDRLNSEWEALSEEQKKSCLIKATTYICTQYVFKGQKSNPDQGVAFPRIGVVDPVGRVVSGVPDCVKQCTCELAVRASKAELIPDPEFDESGRAIKSIQESVGPLKRSVQYAGPGDVLNEARYPSVDALMCSWLLKDTQKEYSNGVKKTSAIVTGVSNSKMIGVSSNTDRYSGPFNENGMDVGGGNDTII